MGYQTYAYLEDLRRRGRRGIGSRRSNGRGNWWRALLTRASEDPTVVLEDSRCHRTEFYDDFADLCDGLSLVACWKAQRPARTAVELARILGDPHRICHSLGVLLHALTASRGNPTETRALLDEYKERARACCPRCESEYYYRYADFLVESRRPEEALAALRESLRLRGTRIEDDWYGRLETIAAIACYHLGDHRQAIDVAGEALRKLDLTSPRGYFIDTVALMVVYLPRADVQFDKRALRHLKSFKKRLVGFSDDIADIRGHLLWAEGILYARLGKRGTAMKRLESARHSLLKHGLAREAAAVTVDHALAYRPRGDEVNAAAVRPLVNKCLRQRTDLSEELVARFEDLLTTLEDAPEDALEELLAIRASFRAPVPGRLGECLYPDLARAAAAAEAAKPSMVIFRRMPTVTWEIVETPTAAVSLDPAYSSTAAAASSSPG